MTKIISALFKVKGIILVYIYLFKITKDARIYYKQTVQNTKLQNDDNAYTWQVAS